ncbi:XRE family transcriptional regulator [Pseudothermotoga sp.]|uniref:XRE family transcriptional regulator n=1 Tax=Pseudothermotoga sp. TaxID=2033661 RepID=UPI0031F6D1EC
MRKYLSEGLVMDYVSIGEKIRLVRNRLGLTQADLAKKLNVDPSTIAYYESGRRQISLEMLQKIANALGVELDYFLKEQEATATELPPVRKFIPLYDVNIRAGNGGFPDSLEPLRLLPVETVDADCAFVVHGRSMEPEINDGDIVLVRRVYPQDVLDGEIVVSMYENQFLVKRLYRDDGKIVLIADNDEYAPITVNPNERFEIIGKVVEVRHVPKRKRAKR